MTLCGKVAIPRLVCYGLPFARVPLRPLRPPRLRLLPFPTPGVAAPRGRQVEDLALAGRPAGFRWPRLFPVPRSPFPVPDVAFSQQVIHNGVCPRVHVANHQIRVKIDQKGDVFRQKGIKKARISSCPS